MTRKQWATIVKWCRERYAANVPRPNYANRQIVDRKLREQFESMWPMLHRGWLFTELCIIPHANLPYGNVPTNEHVIAKLNAHLRDFIEQFDPSKAIPLVWANWPKRKIIELKHSTGEIYQTAEVLERDPAAPRQRNSIDFAGVDVRLWPTLADCVQRFALHDSKHSPIIGYGPGGLVQAVVMPIATVDPSCIREMTP